MQAAFAFVGCGSRRMTGSAAKARRRQGSSITLGARDGRGVTCSVNRTYTRPGSLLAMASDVGVGTHTEQTWPNFLHSSCKVRSLQSTCRSRSGVCISSTRKARSQKPMLR
eukprot:1065522-Prorocentrum_minimum.AAC.1